VYCDVVYIFVCVIVCVKIIILRHADLKLRSQVDVHTLRLFICSCLLLKKLLSCEHQISMFFIVFICEVGVREIY
jgi:hypothetical protein